MAAGYDSEDNTGGAMNGPDKELLNKYIRLKDHIASYGSVAVAFSGGVDSAFLLYAAKDALNDKAVAITAVTPMFPKREQDEACKYCADAGIRHIMVNVDEAGISEFADNPKDRCYLCKRGLFMQFIRRAEEEGLFVVAEGSNLDDESDYRPGHKAIKELNIKSPLREIGFTKNEIRCLSKHFDLPTWNKPSYACLASRIPYGERITVKKLDMIDRAEQALFDMGFSQLRVRCHGDVARIELMPDDFDRFMRDEVREETARIFSKIGFTYTALDVLGYRSGSMNLAL